MNGGSDTELFRDWGKAGKAMFPAGTGMNRGIRDSGFNLPAADSR